MHLVAAETVIAASVALVAAGWPKGRRAPWAGRGWWWLGGALAVWTLGWWVTAVGPTRRLQRLDLGLATVLLAAIAVTAELRPRLLLAWIPLSAAIAVLRRLVPSVAPMGWPAGLIGPEGAVLGLAAGALVGDPVLAAAAAVGSGSVGTLLEGPLGASTWYLVSVAAAVAFGMGALLERRPRWGGSARQRLVD